MEEQNNEAQIILEIVEETKERVRQIIKKLLQQTQNEN